MCQKLLFTVVSGETLLGMHCDTDHWSQFSQKKENTKENLFLQQIKSPLIFLDLVLLVTAGHSH